MAYSVLLILSLGGNSLVIVVICRNRNLQTVINFFILNMAISDLLIPVFAHTKRIKLIYLPRGLWPLGGVTGSITCKLRGFLEYTSISVSVLTLEVIAVERFFSVVFPMKRQPIRSNKTCFIVIVLIWLTGAVYPSTSFYTLKIIHKDRSPYCIYSWVPAFDHIEAAKVDFTIYLVAFIMIPFILLTSLYSAIIISLHRQKANLHLAPEATQRRAKENRRITYMLVTVVVLFLVTCLPVTIYLFLSAFVWSSHRPCESRHLIFSANFLAYNYPAVSPFIYYLFIENYRKSFQELFSCRVRCRSCFKNQNQTWPEIEGNINCTVEPGSPKAVVHLPLRFFEVQQ